MHKTLAFRAGRSVRNGLYAVALILLLLFFLFPFYWMISMSLKNHAAVTAYPPEFVFKPTLANYARVFTAAPFGKYLLNSLLIGFLSVAVSLCVGLPAAYAAARHRLTLLLFPTLMLRMLPGIAFLIPFFSLYRMLHLVDTHLGMVLIHITLSLPLVIWLMIGFFEDISSELEDAATIDGCSRLACFVRIMIPLSLPGIAAATILGFIFSWNNFMYALVLGGRRTMTLPLSVYQFISFEYIDWGSLCAASVLITVPIVVLAIVIQRYLVKGLTLGSVR